MKLNIFFLLILFFSTLAFAQREYARLDNDRGTSMEPILARAEPLIERIEKEGLEIVRMEFDIMKRKRTGCFIRIGNTASWLLEITG